MKIAISVESTADLSKELYEEYHIHFIPFTVNLGERVGKDGEITPNDIYNFVDDTGVLPKTSAINVFEYDQYFKDLRKEYDAIVHISLSEKISSAYNNACASAYKLNNVYVIDSKSLSTGIALLAIYGSKLVAKGLPVEEIVDRINKRVPHVEASFVVNSLNYLYKGGRCTGLQRFGAMLLRLKPQIVLKDGAMVPGKKYRGKSNSVVKEYCHDTLTQFTNPDKTIAFVTHTSASEDMVNTCKEWLKEYGFTNILETVAGATITSHCGPKTIGILFINDGGKD